MIQLFKYAESNVMSLLEENKSPDRTGLLLEKKHVQTGLDLFIKTTGHIKPLRNRT